MNKPTLPTTIFAPSKKIGTMVFLVILVCGLGVRLFDLTDPPLDFASTRQLRSALIARGLYYPQAGNAEEWQREMAVKQGRYSMIEPIILETIVAVTYGFAGGEYIWIARIYSSFFWVLGGIALFFLVKEMVSIDGAYLALTYYLFVPYGIVASRSFQPDPLMTALIVLSWWTFYRWYRTSTWKWALLAGISTGVAMLVKSTAIFFLLIGFAVLILSKEKIGKLIRDTQVWVIVLLSSIPVLVYHLYGVFIVGSLGQQFQGRFFPEMLRELQYYKQWKNAVATVIGHELIFAAAILGLLFFIRKKELGFLLGIWLGYLLYCVGFTYHITTHYYYHLPLIPLTAVLLAGFFEVLIKYIKSRAVIPLARIGLGVILLIGMGGGYYMLHNDDYRNEPIYFKKVADFVGHESKVVALSQDYGYRLSYFGWIAVQPWKGT
ncbi:MAG: glycosyltransferase family 39 protein, partial [Anaerolineales bacterium]|nr:glycosyltransferase family 39 protein [Anaerolineales bacterium]